MRVRFGRIIMIKTDLDQFKRDLETFQKNDTAISEKDKKGKYRKAYQSLRHKLQEEVNSLSTYILTFGRFLPEDGKYQELFCSNVSEFLKQERQLNGSNSFLERSHVAIYQHYDILEFIKIIYDLEGQTQDLYRPYWNHLCYMDGSGQVRNKLIPGYTWNDENKIWEAERGNEFVCLLCPPSYLYTDAEPAQQHAAQA